MTLDDYLDNPTRGYQRSWWAQWNTLWYGSYSGTVFNYQDVPFMRTYPVIQFGLEYSTNPYTNIKLCGGKLPDGSYKPLNVANRPDATAFVERCFKQFWMVFPKLMKQKACWGRWAAGVEFEWNRDLRILEISRVRDVEPNDTDPRVFKNGRRRGDFAGFEIRSSTSTARYVTLRHALYYAGDEEEMPFVDTPLLKGAHTPWMEANVRGGARASRRLAMWRKAIGSTIIRFPQGVKVPNPSNPREQIDAQDAARIIGELMMNGSLVMLNNKTDQNGKYIWEIEERESPGNGTEIKNITETIQQLNDEMYLGMKIPQEIFDSRGTGSYSGKSIPMESWYTRHDSAAARCWHMYRESHVDRLVRDNYGIKEYDAELTSLLADFRQQNGAGPGKVGDQGGDQGGGGNRPGPGAPYVGPRGGHGTLGPDGKPRYGDQEKRRERADLSDLWDDAARASSHVLHKSIALAMLKAKAHELKGNYDEDTAGDIIHWLPHFAHDTDEATAAMKLKPINLSAYGDWEMRGTTASGKTRWYSKAAGQYRYQKSKPGTWSERKKTLHGIGEKGMEIIERVAHNRHTPEELHQLAAHIHAMDVPQLRRARKYLSATFMNGKQRDHMTAALTRHVQHLINHVGHGDDAPPPPRRPLSGAAAKGAKRANGTPANPVNHDVYTVDPKALKTDPERFQYKVVGIGSGGVSEELKGTDKWNPELGGTLLVWRDPKDGQDYVINGHHRHELASRVGTDKVNVRYIDAHDAVEARARGALANIAEGRGTATDAAKYLRDSGQDIQHLKNAGVSMSGRVAGDAEQLKDLSDKAFQRLTTGDLDEKTAVDVARHLKDPKLQDTLFKMIDGKAEEGKPWSSHVIQTAAKKMARAGSTTVKNDGGLFGDWEDEQSTFGEESELESHIKRHLQKQANDFAAVGNTGRAERVKEAGNTLAVEENQRRAKQANDHILDFDRESGLKSPISEAIKEEAANLKRTTKPKEQDAIKQRTLERVRGLLAAGATAFGRSEAGPVASNAGTSGSGGTGEPGDLGTSGDTRAQTGAGDGGDVTPKPSSSGRKQIGTDLLGNPIYQAPAASNAVQPTLTEDIAPGLWMEHARAHAEAAGLKIDQFHAGGRFRSGEQWYQVGKAEDGYPVFKSDADGKAEPGTPGTVHESPALGTRREFKYKFHPGRNADEVGISYHDEDKPRQFMPKDSAKHFINDLAGRVDVPKTGHAVIDAVINGEAEHLGKGDDGVVFGVGDKVAKMSTTVPFQPFNPGHRSPLGAANMLDDQIKTNNKLHALGIPGVLPMERVASGDKVFGVRDKLDMPKPGELTPEQMNKVRHTIDRIHEAGYVVGDQIQVGLKNGEPYLYDLGKAQKAHDDRDFISDSSRFEMFQKQHGHEELPLKKAAESFLENSDFAPPEDVEQWRRGLAQSTAAAGTPEAEPAPAVAGPAKPLDAAKARDAANEPLPAHAVAAGVKSWADAHRKGLTDYINEAPGMVRGALEPIATHLGGRLGPIADHITAELIRRVGTGGNHELGIRGLANDYESRDNGEPGDAERNRKIADALRTIEKKPAPVVEPADAGLPAVVDGKAVKYVRAKAGGEVSPVTGQHYKGGQLMPIHGAYAGQERGPTKPPLGVNPGATPPEGKKEPENDARGGGRAPMSPEDAAAKREAIEQQRRYAAIRNGPLGSLKFMPENGFPRDSRTDLPKWRQFAEQLGPDAVARLTANLEAKVHGHIDAEAAATGFTDAAGIQWEKDQAKRAAQDTRQYFPRLAKTHEAAVPGSLYARHLLEHALDQKWDGAKTGLEQYEHVNKMLQDAGAAPAAPAPTPPSTPAAAPAGEPVGPREHPGNGKIVKDSKGNEYLVMNARFGVVNVAPIVGGKVLANSESRISFMVDPNGSPSSDLTRKEPLFKTGRDFYGPDGNPLSTPPSTPAAAPEPAPLPAPHEVPLAEFLKQPNAAEDESSARARHRAVVAQELEDGNPVAPEVLADYPDLAAKHAAKIKTPPPGLPEPPPSVDAAPKPEPALPPDATPREQAAAETAIDESSAKYKFARASTVGNLGEDLLGSARHKRNEWRGLEDAEKNGTAAELIKRDHLLQAEPHKLGATIEPATALTHLAAHFAMNTFPAEIDEKQVRGYTDPDRMARNPQLNPDKLDAAGLRAQYYEAYNQLKTEAERLAVEHTDPKDVLTAMEAKAKELIYKYRGHHLSEPTGYNGQRFDRFKDPSNPVANALVDTYKRLGWERFGRPKANTPQARVLDFGKRLAEKYGATPTAEHLEAAMGHALDVMDGDSVNKTFGTQGAGRKPFSAADQYVTHAERKGGRVIDTSTIEAGSRHMMENVKLRGLQWGNSVSDEERQHHLAHSAGALADLADATGFDDEHIGLGGKLGLAIGARGRGGARAHYEPDTKVINLSRASGVGSLAHEWGHALDHAITGHRGFATENSHRAPPAVAAAYGKLQKALDDSGFSLRLGLHLRELQESKVMSAKERAYWSSRAEVFARTFERHVQKKLHDQGRENTYLTGLRKVGHPLWPTNAELDKIGPAMDEFLKAARDTIDGKS